MIAAGTKYWNPDALLTGNTSDIDLSVEDFVVYPLYKDDYLFTNEEIRAEQDALHNIGLTQRLVVERTADGYSLIGPLLPYLALLESGADRFPCIVRSGDLPQVQQVLSIRLNAEYTRLSPLVYSRLISRLERLFPVMKTVSGMNLGIKRDWIASILGISPSAVLRYSYISKVPAPLQLRCNNPNFPYLCYKDVLSFSDVQFHQLLDELIHYELRSRYTTITSSELSAIIQDIAEGHISDNNTSAEPINTAVTPPCPSTRTTNSDTIAAPFLPAVYEPLAENFYQNLQAQFEERYEDDVDAGTASDLFRIAHKDGYYVPDETLQEVAYTLYSLSRARLAGGQKLQNYACLRSILDSASGLYDHLVL